MRRLHDITSKTLEEYYDTLRKFQEEKHGKSYTLVHKALKKRTEQM